ncbi:P-loop containing nucleoside triphosphate hydrolase protein [Coniophora puteana RWD-64-598 SS2]|uniref:RNA helicase n=1 Tax=Coniophora puteana (strain RWD-64-598) TaxID=741705 RepID=A0A5M3MPI4_CONPW|nr:P-loop containing nucleoside triphosphate hydrolase protein [Coniophora puteana RWD-64-598 SS2]EIW80970.1 P-loop containing nucleoside triphosphate hydrolase protein [Coniophora puteana RWD-64-598 SS2]
MPLVRQPGYNHAARQSTAGSRKKGKRKPKGQVVDVQSSSGASDPNAVVHVPKTQEQKDRERKEKLVQELAAQSESKVSVKKRKRLEKYIDKKLAQEERVKIIEKLAKSQEQTSSLNLQSSSTLGTGKASTNQVRLDKAEDREVRKALDGRTNRRRRQPDFSYHAAVSSESEGESMEGISDAEDKELTREVVVVDATTGPSTSRVVSSAAIGSALRRNADGTVATPKIVPKKTKGVKSAWGRRKQPSQTAQDSDTSFDSSDSANDTDHESQASSSTSEETGEDGEVGDEGSPSAQSENDSESASESEEETHPAPSKRKSFKDWATNQLSMAKGYTPTSTDEAVSLAPDLMAIPVRKRRKTSHDGEMRGPLGEDLKLASTSFAAHLQDSSKPSESKNVKKKKAVTVSRPSEVEDARMLLPILAEEQPIMEAVLLNPVVVICGETGSGKTTQLPQFLYEAGFGDPDGDNPGMIGITQPRRVAAMSMASRVAHELSLTSSKVSYQIRYDATVSPSTTIKFMTDGVLLRELATDFLLTKYSVIIIDEAHERSMNTDILIGVLSRVIKLRERMWTEGKAKPLRLIIMSATLRVSDFADNTTLFATPPPVINVSARQHPVTTHFSRRTVSDYVGEAVKKASKIHTRLPPGGILIFLTGQNEINGVCKRLEAKYGRRAIEDRKNRRQAPPPAVPEMQEVEGGVNPTEVDVEAEEVNLGVEEADLHFELDDDEGGSGSDSEMGDDEIIIDMNESEVPMHVVPLYSLLPSEKQMQVFKPPPAGHRLVVVSTNIAETSLTIPNIRYVIDCGRAKERKYDVASGIQSFQVGWISKASAAQRTGRAGRTGPGHCYRLYSSALFEHYFDAFSQPEILRTPIEGVVLQMKSMNIDAVANFPFPTPPSRELLKKAETVLTRLGAFSSSAIPGGKSGHVMSTVGGSITPLGKAMALFPLHPRYSRMLVSGQQHGCLPYVISVVAALSVGDPFLAEDAVNHDSDGEYSDDEDGLGHIRRAKIREKEARKIRRRAFFESQQVHASLGKSTSDIFRILSVVGAYEYAGGGHRFCQEHFVRPKAMEEIHKLRAQLSNIVQINFPGTDAKLNANLRPPTDQQLKVIRQLIAAAFIDQVAIRKDLVKKETATGVQSSTTKGIPYRALGIDEDVFIHPASLFADRSPPDYVVFHDIVRTSRPWLKTLTVVNVAWLSALGKPSLCTFSKPAKNSKGILMSIPHFGPERWELPPVKAEVV